MSQINIPLKGLNEKTKMNTKRLTLSSPSLSNRVKKFDTYQHNARTSQRMPFSLIKQRKDILQTNKSPANIIFKTVKTPAHTSIKPIDGFRVVSTDSKVSSDSTSRTHRLALHAVKKSSNVDSGILSKQFSEEKNKKSKKMSLFQKIFYGFGVFIFLFAGGVSVQTLITNHQAKEQIGVLGEQTQVADDQGVAEGTGSEPAEAEVSSQTVANYYVSPELPRYLRIPELGVFARIKHTGVTADGAVDAPKNINDVSWFNQGAVPGNSIGSSLLLGHVSGWSAPGVFKKIDKMRAGMRFEVEKGSGEKLTYEVTRGEKIPIDQVDMSRILGTEVAGEHDLKLMTCSGKYNKETKQYEDRYVVFAKIIR